MATKHIPGIPDPDFEEVKVYGGLYWGLFIGTFVAYAILLFIAWTTWDSMLIPDFEGLNIGFPILALVLIHFFSSWGMVDKDEWAAFYFYGRALRLLSPGPYFKPTGLMQIERAPRKLRQFQAPGEPEEVFYEDNKVPLPSGMVRPIRITTRAAKEGETGHLDVQMTASWSFYVQYQIKDFFRFIANVGDFDHAKMLIRDTGEAVLNDFASKHTMNGMIENLTAISEELDNRIRVLTQRWGMEIYEARILSPDVSHTLATELRNVPAERLRAEQTRTKAEAERERLVQEGAGTASAKEALLMAEAVGREAFLTAEAAGLKAKREALDIDGETVIVAEVASDAFKHADSVVVGAGDGIRDLMGMLKAGSSVLNPKGKST